MKFDPTTESADSNMPSVLLVEPEAETREVLTTILELHGLRILQAEEPEQGLRMARAERPDVIVVDFDQPSMHIEMQRELAAQTRQPHCGLIVLGNAPPVRPLSTNRYIAKPFHYGPLVQTIERLIGKAA